jgi:proteic killer suppression protein
MEVLFKNKKLKKQFTEAKERQKTFGSRARGVNTRYMDLCDAKNLAVIRTIPSALLHKLLGDRKDQYSVVANNNYKIVFEINHNPLPLLPDGGVDLSKVSSIKIIEVVDYHKK